MSNAKHTPGPWVAKAGLSNWGITTAYGQRTFAIARINSDRVEQEANARLIAAAPELLEALEGLCGRVAQEIAPTHTPRMLDEHPVFAEARTAIAKARGGAE